MTQEEKAKSEAIIAAIGDGISILDTNLRIIYQNNVHMEMVGGNYAGNYCYQVYDGTNEICPECPVVLAIQDGLIHKSEKEVKYRHNVSNIEITASPLRNATGEIIAGIEVVRDISKRKSAEEKLKKRTAAVEASIDGIAILNGAGEYTYMNQAHARVYGYDTAEELLGKSWRVLYDEKEVQRFESDIVPLLEVKGTWRGEALGRRIDGSTFPQEILFESALSSEDFERRVIADAASAGISLLSITDHDCMDAYPAALELARSASMEIIPGVELTTKNEQGCNCIHIVGLGIRTDDGVRRVLRKVVDARDRADQGFLENLNRFFAKKYPGWEPTQGIKPSVFQNTLANASRQGIFISEKEMMDIILNPSLWVPIELETTLNEALK